MTDKELMVLAIAQIRAALTLAALPGTVAQSRQPTAQGVEEGPVVYLHHAGGRRYGYQGKTDAYNAGLGRIDHVEDYWLERSFQVDALVPYVPTELASPTAFDYVDAVAAYLQTDQARAAFKGAGVGILRITDVREPYIVDDKDQHELAPSFDFTLTYKQTRTTEAPQVSTFEPGTYPT